MPIIDSYCAHCNREMKAVESAYYETTMVIWCHTCQKEYASLLDQAKVYDRGCHVGEGHRWATAPNIQKLLTIPQKDA